MNSSSKIQRTAILVLATLGLGSLAQAETTPDAAPAIAPTQWHHSARDYERGPRGGMLHVLHQLNLDDAQKQQVHAITSSARTQWRSQNALDAGDLVALGNPGDPNHAAALAAAKARAAQRIENWSDVQQQIYAVLTPAQQAQLPQLLSEMQNRHSGRHDAHAPSADGTTGS
jgi:Spy/CpxP family protein refolding chaperone